jgi:hypothetical protein
MKLQEQINRIQSMMGTINEEISEEIDAKEAYTEYNSVKTIIDGKRDIAFTTLFSPIVSIMIRLNGLKKMKLPQSDNYIVYRKDVIDKAKELYDIANKYGGFLHYDANEEDSRKIGKLLGYKESDIEKYIERNMKIRTNLPEQINRIQSMMGTLNESKLQKKLQDEIDSVGLITFMNQSKLSIEEIANVLKTTPLQLTKDFFLDKSFSIDDFDVNTGGYDFNFEITDIDQEGDDLLYIYTKIGNGSVSLMDGETYDLWNSGLWDEDYWWEIQKEINDLIYDVIKPFISKNLELDMQHNLM